MPKNRSWLRFVSCLYIPSLCRSNQSPHDPPSMDDRVRERVSEWYAKDFLPSVIFSVASFWESTLGTERLRVGTESKFALESRLRGVNKRVLVPAFPKFVSESASSTWFKQAPGFTAQQLLPLKCDATFIELSLKLLEVSTEWQQAAGDAPPPARGTAEWQQSAGDALRAKASQLVSSTCSSPSAGGGAASVPAPPASTGCPLLRPLLAIGAAFVEGAPPPAATTFSGKDLSLGSKERNMLLFFARAFPPPSLPVLFGFETGMNVASRLLSSSEGLESAFARILGEDPPASTSILDSPATKVACFLESLEIGPQLFNRATLANVEGISTQDQTISADFDIQTFACIHKDAIWQWRGHVAAFPDKYKPESSTPGAWPKSCPDLPEDHLALKIFKTQCVFLPRCKVSPD